MRVALVGATGRTGRETARVLRERGHEVVGVVRDPQRAGVLGLDLDALVKAEAHDTDALRGALAEVDAVLSCIGPVKGESVTVMQDTIAPLIAAMHERGVRRLVVVSASGWIVDGDDPLSRFLLKPVLDRFLGDTNADLAATERLVRASGLDWTIVRPPRLTGRPGRGRYRARRDGNVRWGFFISRADLALALVDALENAGAAGRTVSVAG